MKNGLKRVIMWVLIAAFALGSAADGSAARAVDYSKYSNTKKSWYIMRQDKHKASGGADSASNLKKYDAYYYDNKTKDKVMYFCFDCGYEAGYTKGMLDVLKKHDVKATFFVTKAFVEEQPKLCKRMKKEGHIVGSHTMNHPSIPGISLSRLKKEIKGLESLFKKKTGYELDKFIRPPMGPYSNRTLKYIKDMGYKTIFWSIAYMDYDVNKQPGKTYVVDHFKKYYHKGAITLTHNTSKSNAQALDDVLTFLEGKGYGFRTVYELECSNNK